MENNKLNNTVDQFLTPKNVKRVSQDGMEREECDLVNVTQSEKKTES